MRVNGPAAITMDSSALGYSNDGVEISIEEGFSEVFTDQLGPFIPTEVLRNGQRATISWEMSKYDASVLGTLLQKRSGGGTQGTFSSVGEMMFANNRTSTLSIASPVEGDVWTFNRCWISASSTRLSTQQTVWRITVTAVPDGSGILYAIT